jgi:predicted polyphosphate/ATP-dependent NAD kinase
VKVGLIVNPISGMGGTVGLKGTDGKDVLLEAMARGAVKIAPGRTETTLRAIRRMGLGLEFVTCAGEMGLDELSAAGLVGRTVYSPTVPSSRADSIRAAKTFLGEKVDLILFSGGDGTARDLLEAVGGAVPLVGIPSGVKMHSAVFANTPEEAADLVQSFARSRTSRKAEVMDIDEEKFRQGTLQAKLFGYASVPDDIEHMQAGKTVYHSGSADVESEEIGQYVAESLEKGVLYILGPGSTTESIAGHLKLKKTLLGVDALLNGSFVKRDASEADLLDILERCADARIIVSPIGAQGFFFGRGNQQISARVIRKVGPANTLVVATPSKLKGTPVLRVDTGDAELDEGLRGRRRVVTGYRRRKLVSVK